MDNIIAGALIDFCGRLSTLEKPITCGAKYETAPALIYALQAWARDRELSLDDVNHDWWERERHDLVGFTDQEVLAEAGRRIGSMINALDGALE